MTSSEDEPGLSTEQVAAISGTTFRVIDHWARQGYLHTLPRRESSGVKRRFGRFEAAVAAQTAILARCGFTVEAAVRVARTLVTHQVTRIVLDEGIVLLVASPVKPSLPTT